MGTYIHDALKIRNINNSSLSLGTDTEGNFFVPESAVSVTMRCTLNCKLCTVKTSMYKTPEHPPLTDIKRWFTRYFEIADFTMKLTITGGEPLLRKDLGEIVEYLSAYKNQFGRLRINTNGTIVPNDKLVAALDLYKTPDYHQAEVLIDDYPASTNVQSAAEMLEETGIPYIVRNYRSGDYWFDGWVNYGDFKRKSNIVRNCNCRHVALYLRREKIYFCDKQPSYEDFSPHDGNLGLYGEYVLLSDDGIPVAEKRKQIQYLFNLNLLRACYFCNGRSEDSKRYKPAQQFTAQELNELRRDFVAGEEGVCV